MKVTTRRVPTFDAILSDGNFRTLTIEFSRYRLVRAFASRAIKIFLTEEEITSGRNGIDVMHYARLLSARRAGTPHDAVEAVERAAIALRALYQAHNPDHVRGAVIEGLAETRLRIRYTGKLLENNVEIALSNGLTYTSSTSVDVLGWDGSVGECHDCKVDAAKFDRAWITELETDVAPNGFKIGLVTADGFQPATFKLGAGGITLDPKTTLISLERLWQFAPLQP